MSLSFECFLQVLNQRRYDMNLRSQMQGGKNKILWLKEINAKRRFFRYPHWLEIWTNHVCPSMGQNGLYGLRSSLSEYTQYKLRLTLRIISILK